MRKILFGVIITLLILFSFKYCGDQKQNEIILQEQSSLIQKEIQNVGKLVVTEGHFSEVLSYENSKTIFGDWLEAEKKALVVVNADVTIAYDLSKIQFELDKTSKTLRIISIPQEEIKISPEIQYYDIQSDYFNQFEAEDYNAIAQKAKESVAAKVDRSELRSNARNRLISELSKFYILTNSLGWTLQYNETPIEQIDNFYKLKL
ncbi:MAG: DUF4230 domain-containing protein [Psychroserpens sp.]|nr:DUF4230 domain-containing protein [Psychroserpens sp.]